MVHRNLIGSAMLLVALSGCGKDPNPGQTSGPDGGGIPSVDGGYQLAGVATVTFASGALPPQTSVALQKATDAPTLAAFDDGAGSFNVTNRISYFLRITTGKVQPAGSATVDLVLPDGFAVSSTEHAAVFARIFYRNEDEGLDAFEPLGSIQPTASGTVRAIVPQWAFTSARSTDGTVEAVVVIATLPAASGSRLEFAATGRVCENPTVACAVGCMRTPLLRTLRAKRGINLVPDPSDVAFHPGIDLRAEIGPTAVAVGAGTVIESRSSKNFPADCTFPTNCPNKGMGETILLDVAGVGRVRYMHLSSRAIGDCCTGNHCTKVAPDLDSCTATVSKGQILGATGNTGYSQGPHLHMELISGADRVDPGPCILPPDYHGEFKTVSTATAGDAYTIEFTTTATAKFEWSEGDRRYKAQGTWHFDVTRLTPECAVTVQEPKDGAIGDGDAAFLLLGGVDQKLLTSNYLFGTSVPPLEYVGIAGNSVAQRADYDCTEPDGTHKTGKLNFAGVIWWPNTLGSPNSPFFARPNPYDGSSPYEDFEETDVPALPPPYDAIKATWKVTARKTE